jgi:hypothetical protein
LIEIGLRSVTSTIAESLDSTTKNKEIRKRKEIAQHHGFRKFTHTTMTNKKINPEVREMLLGHSIGLSGAYYRPSASEMLNEYLLVVNDLTINDENRLSKKVQELQEKNQDKDYVIKGKLQEKDDEIRGMKEQINEMNKKFEQVFSMIQQNPILTQVKPEMLADKKLIESK